MEPEPEVSKQPPNVKEVLDSLLDKVKTEVIVKNCFNEETAFWREQFEAERLAMVPAITCRIC